jgi:hypothetical protein
MVDRPFQSPDFHLVPDPGGEGEYERGDGPDHERGENYEIDRHGFGFVTEKEIDGDFGPVFHDQNESEKQEKQGEDEP